MSKTAYNISLKGYVGGYDFDRATVDKELSKNDKRVSRINLVLDHMATNKTLKLWAFISQVIERTYLGDNHSKILLVKSEAGDTVSADVFAKTSSTEVARCRKPTDAAKPPQRSSFIYRK